MDKNAGRRKRKTVKEKEKGRFSRHFDDQSSTVQEEKSIHALRTSMGTKILEFDQTPRDREFSYFEYF